MKYYLPSIASSPASSSAFLFLLTGFLRFPLTLLNSSEKIVKDFAVMVLLTVAIAVIALLNYFLPPEPLSFIPLTSSLFILPEPV